MWSSYFGEVSSLSNPLHITGVVDPKFLGVRQAFEDNFLLHDEIGASVCVMVDRSVVVRLSGGWQDKEKRKPWLPTTLVNSFSVGKGILSILHALALTRAQMSPDDRVESVWPQMSRSAVGKITLRDLCSHRAGLPAIKRPLAPSDLYNWATMTQALCDQEPEWTPGSQHGYHVNTFGFLVGEVINQLQQSLPKDLLKPLDPFVHNEMFWGVPKARHKDVATLYWHNEQTSPSAHTSSSEPSLHALAYSNPENFSGLGAVNSSQWRSNVHPSTNLHTSAFAIAAAYESVRSGALPIAPSVLQEATSTASRGDDFMLATETHFGMGFQLPTSTRRFGPQDCAFGHYGAGGSVGFCDPVAKISMGYTMNQMGKGWQNKRNQSLIEAIYASL